MVEAPGSPDEPGLSLWEIREETATSKKNNAPTASVADRLVLTPLDAKWLWSALGELLGETAIARGTRPRLGAGEPTLATSIVVFFNDGSSVTAWEAPEDMPDELDPRKPFPRGDISAAIRHAIDKTCKYPGTRS